ncbi:unnamed protein product [Blepharisma stoltei]|uniref:Uncharacterized protein n=1 Tax=Blepharisma stoltei TaxID=1481888 RepID=A0AAU9INM0_9CILI|nr:unnamed protein product [Blepharisma stoltei]
MQLFLDGDKGKFYLIKFLIMIADIINKEVLIILRYSCDKSIFAESLYHWKVKKGASDLDSENMEHKFILSISRKIK